MDNLYEIHNSFDNVQNDIEQEKYLQQYVNKYIALKNELRFLKDRIDGEAKSTNFYFDEESCLLFSKNDRGIFLNYYFKFYDKIEYKYNVTSNTVKLNDNCFKAIEKYLKNDKEKICELLNNKELLKKYEELYPITESISKLFCGICLTNNILNIITENYENDIIYSVELNQMENNEETFYGNITFLFSVEQKAKKKLEKIDRN